MSKTVDLSRCPGGPLDPSKKKEYKQMMRAYKKLLKKDAKEAHPFDWECGMALFIDFLGWMRAYYKLGYNVWAADITDPKLDACYTEKTRADSIDEAIKLYNRWQNICDDYYKIAYSEEEIKHYQRLGFHLVPTDNDEIEKAMERTGSRSLTLYEDARKNSEACNKAYKETKHAFFEYLEKHIEEWWD